MQHHDLTLNGLLNKLVQFGQYYFKISDHQTNFLWAYLGIPSRYVDDMSQSLIRVSIELSDRSEKLDTN